MSDPITTFGVIELIGMQGDIVEETNTKCALPSQCMSWDSDPTLLTRAPQEGQGPSSLYHQVYMLYRLYKEIPSSPKILHYIEILPVHKR